jgi:hypothetical protein
MRALTQPSSACALADSGWVAWSTRPTSGEASPRGTLHRRSVRERAHSLARPAAKGGGPNGDGACTDSFLDAWHTPPGNALWISSHQTGVVDERRDAHRRPMRRGDGGQRKGWQQLWWSSVGPRWCEVYATTHGKERAQADGLTHREGWVGGGAVVMRWHSGGMTVELCLVELCLIEGLLLGLLKRMGSDWSEFSPTVWKGEKQGSGGGAYRRSGARFSGPTSFSGGSGCSMTYSRRKKAVGEGGRRQRLEWGRKQGGGGYR